MREEPHKSLAKVLLFGKLHLRWCVLQDGGLLVELEALHVDPRLLRCVFIMDKVRLPRNWRLDRESNAHVEEGCRDVPIDMICV